MATMLTPDGKVAIPAAIRDALGLEPGSAVEFELAPDGRVVMAKAPDEEPLVRFEKLRGCAGPGMTTDEIMALTRGDERHDAG